MVRLKIICEKSKIYKKSQKASKIKKKNTKLPSKKVPSYGNRWKKALFLVTYVIYRFFFFAQDHNFSKIHKSDK
jgi:hypothetical protein